MKTKTIKTAFISVYHKEGLEPIVKKLHELGVIINSTGGTATFIKDLNIPVIDAEEITGFPSILGGRVKTLHPNIFGGILARRDNPEDMEVLEKYNINPIDLVIVDLYPFEETVAKFDATQAEKIEKIDIGGISLIRAAAKNYEDVAIVSNMNDYSILEDILNKRGNQTSIDERKLFVCNTFETTRKYETAISEYFETWVRPSLPIEL